MTEQFISSVRVETKGAHDHVTVWVRGQLVGTLVVGLGDGKAVRALLLGAEEGERKKLELQHRTAVDHWLRKQLAADARIMQLEATIADHSRGSTHELVRYWLEKTIEIEAIITEVKDAFDVWQHAANTPDMNMALCAALRRALAKADKTRLPVTRPEFEQAKAHVFETHADLFEKLAEHDTANVLDRYQAMKRRGEGD